MKNSKKGFTLVEMFIVILVIGILSGIVFQGAAGIQAAGRDTRRISDIRSIQLMLEQFADICGHYPGTFIVAPDPCRAPTMPTRISISALAETLVTAGIVTELAHVPNDPHRGRLYEYAVNAGGTSYVLQAQLERRHRVLNEDIDGPNVLGVNCADDAPNFFYCVRP